MKRLFIVFLTTAASLFAGTYSGGSGTSAVPYQIGTATDLIELSQTSSDWSKDFIQTADISFNADETQVDWDNDGSPDGVGTSGLLPIGSTIDKFTGEYDGNEHTIDYLYIHRPSKFYIGLFGYVDHSNISDLGLKNLSIEGSAYTGGIVGSLNYASIENCFCDGNGLVLGNYDNLGGICGNATQSSVIDCYNESRVYGTGEQDSDLEKRSSLVGGIVGQAGTGSSIIRCFNTARIFEFGTHCGGIVGGFNGTMSNCYNTGEVLINNDMNSFWVGGLVASVQNSATITNCYSSGEVSGVNIVGGMIASNSGTVNHSFWDTEASKQASSSAGTGKTTEQMTTKSTYSDEGWDFTDTWAISSSVNGGYPYLQDNAPADAATPITLQSFTAEQNGGSIVLAWSTASESNNARFIIYRNNDMVGSIKGAGSSSETHTYSFTDNTVICGTSYHYVLADVNFANEVIRHNDKTVHISLNNDIMETDFTLGDAYPNPFNPTTVLPLSLKKNADVQADIYDLNGRRIMSLVKGHFSAGSHDLMINAGNMNSGIYVIRVLVNEDLQVHKIALLR